MKRSGSTLQFNLVSELLERHGLGVGLTTFEVRERKRYPELRYNVTKGHPFHPLPSKSLVFLSIRHPLDCIVSTMQLQKCSFFSALTQMRVSCEQSIDWHSSYPECHLVRYEDLFNGNHIVRLFAELYRVSAYLGLQPDSKVILGIAKNNSFWNIKKQTGFQSTNNSTTWYASGHLIDGKVEKYKTYLSIREIEYASGRLENFMMRFGYEHNNN